jgi:hypothetical protein
MIRKDVKEGWILINQNDHAHLSGEIMAHWGDGEFTKPEPRDEVLFAIREHDTGWREWDSSPKVNPVNQFPINFLEMNSYEQGEIWTRCFKRHSAEHPYASALIALHFGKLNEKSLNKNSNNGTAKASHREIINFVSRMLGINISNLDLNSLPRDVRVNLRHVQIGDVISLALCHGWPSIQITDVPFDYKKGPAATLSLKSTDGNNYVISPYPFTEPLIEFRIKGRRLNQKKFSTDDELRQKLNESKYETLDFSIRKE